MPSVPNEKPSEHAEKAVDGPTQSAHGTYTTPAGGTTGLPGTPTVYSPFHP